MSLEKKHILIIHPEGNIYNNPHLYEMVRFLRERFVVRLLVPNSPTIRDSDEFEELIVAFWPRFNRYFEWALRNSLLFGIVNVLFGLMYLRGIRFDMIIGVDQIGLINAYFLAHRYRVPYALISYEILFRSECSDVEKRLEVIASKNLAFAVTQDENRAHWLFTENQIAEEKAILMPVASSFVKPYRKDYSLYGALGIPQHMKVLLFVGSVSSWTCLDRVVQNIEQMPEDWVLLLHDRYGNTQKKIKGLLGGKELVGLRIFISDMELRNTAEMHRLLHCADIGLALYCPDGLSKYTGENLTHVGLASGKISTYLQNGVPVVTTANRALRKLSPRNEVISFIETLDGLFSVLRDFQSSPKINQACVDFFSKTLSFDLYSQILENKIVECLDTNCISRTRVS